MSELLFRGGELIDGTGSDRQRTDVLVREGRISAIGSIPENGNANVLDISGKILAPGFIDVHNHSDGWLLKRCPQHEKISQGFTTEVIMADGISYAPVTSATAPHWMYYLRSLNGLRPEDYSGWKSIAEYLEVLNGRNVQNVATHVPYANVRTAVMGWGKEKPDGDQSKKIQALIREGMETGAVGLSTGLDYVAEWFADTNELVSACKAIADFNGLYVTHIRYRMGHLEALKEAVEIGRRAGVRVHISHLKGESDEQNEHLLKYIDDVAVHEVDFSFEVYPYGASSTMLHSLLPYDLWVDGPLAVADKLKQKTNRAAFAEALAHYRLDPDRISIGWVPGEKNKHYHGCSLSEYAQRVDKPLAEAVCDLLIEEDLAVLMVLHRGSDTLAEPFLAHPKGMLGSDGIFFEGGAINPRAYGSATKLLGPWVRDGKISSLEEAVFKLSGFPAERFGLKNRGMVQEGAFADLVVFDAEHVTDRSTFEDPHQVSEGIEQVFVKGTRVWDSDAPDAEGVLKRPGQVLRAEFSHPGH